MKGPSVLHVFKISNSLQKHYYLGSTKDIRSRTEYFQNKGIDAEDVLVKGKEFYREHFIRKVHPKKWKHLKAVVLEMTFSPDAIGFIRKKAPRAKVLVRSHNAELLHRLHWARACGFFSKMKWRMMRQAFDGWRQDRACARQADYILSISHWETENYWYRIAKKSKIKTVPFFLTSNYAQELRPSSKKSNVCVQLGSSIKNQLVADATRNYVHLVDRLGPRADHWEFCITGEVQECSEARANGRDRIRRLGLLDDPYIPLREARAMAHLSDLGYGFKTKILEAIMAKTYVLLPGKLYDRLPLEMRPFCRVVDPKSADSFLEALEACRQPFPPGDPNEVMRNQAYDSLDEIFLSP